MKIGVQQQLLDALEEIDRPASFCTSGKLPAVLPGLKVKGVGEIALPLSKRQAAALKKQAHQAPYGKGEQTLVDTDVRRVWEIDADQVTFANPEWPKAVEAAVWAVQMDLGLQNQKLTSHLYKLLLYEPGSFFLPHRDGEKLDRMVGTMVITLPSAHEGGELIVRHEGREETIHFGGDQNAFQTQFAAFYADCEHEIRPVKSGFRLSLIYNLTLLKSKRKITAPTSRRHIDAVSRILDQWKDEAEPEKLAVLLDHQYTEAGLGYDALKGVDRAKASVLFEAAAQSDCMAYLALVTLWECGAAEDDGYYGGYGYGYDEDEDAGGDYTMGDIIDSTLFAGNFSDVRGPVSFGEIRLDEDELVSDEPMQEREPDDEEYEGYTGNAGMTLDRWYHRAAIVLWPADWHFSVLRSAGITAAVGGLEQLVAEWQQAKTSDQPAFKQECLAFARQLIAEWPKIEYADRYRSETGTPRDEILALFVTLDDPSLIEFWLRDALPSDARVDPGKSVGNVCRRYGWLTFEKALRAVLKGTTNETIARNTRLYADWCLRRDKDAKRQKLCKNLGKEMLAAVERWGAEKQDALDWRSSEVDRAEMLSLLIKSFIAVNERTLLKRLADHVLALPEKYDLTTAQVPVFLELQSWLKRNVEKPLPPLRRWLAAIQKILESRAGNPPQKPTDWRRDSSIPCPCGDCEELSKFLRDPAARVLRMPLATERRKHLHRIVEANLLDVTHVTERRGRPFTLVFTKTNASYQRALEAHQNDLKQLRAIQKLAEWHDSL